MIIIIKKYYKSIIYSKNSDIIYELEGLNNG